MNRRKPRYYLKNISRRWQAELKGMSEKVIILSPYLTSRTAESILKKSNFSECEIYTIFSIQNFISGASSLKTLKILHQQGCKLYHLPRLHAKMIIVPGKFVTIGSQNVTRNGVKNKEASVLILDELEIKKIEKDLERWLHEGKVINSEMISELELKIKGLRRKFNLINQELRKEINDLESEIWEKEYERLKQEEIDKKAEEIKKIEEEKIKGELRKKQEIQTTIINSARVRVGKISNHGEVNRELAEEFIRQSAYWDHPKSRTLVHAPGHEEHIYGSRDNWRIDFGANTFLVGHAITRCQQTILDFLNQIEAGYIMPLTILREKLALNIRG